MEHRRSKLLTVEDTFLIGGRNVIVGPKISLESYTGPCFCVVTLRMLDGEERTARASFDIPHAHPPADFYLCQLLTSQKTMFRLERRFGSMKTWPNQTRKPTPGERLGCNRASLARRGCAHRSV